MRLMGTRKPDFCSLPFWYQRSANSSSGTVVFGAGAQRLRVLLASSSGRCSLSQQPAWITGLSSSEQCELRLRTMAEGTLQTRPGTHAWGRSLHHPGGSVSSKSSRGKPPACGQGERSARGCVAGWECAQRGLQPGSAAASRSWRGKERPSPLKTPESPANTAVLAQGGLMQT